MHRLDSGILGCCSRIFQFLLHRLHHHDGIVYHRTDDQYQSKEGNEVECETHHIHKGKGAHKRDDDAYGRNDGGAPVLQEQQYHENDEQEGLEQCLVNRIHGGIEEVVGV